MKLPEYFRLPDCKVNIYQQDSRLQLDKGCEDMLKTNAHFDSSHMAELLGQTMSNPTLVERLLMQQLSSTPSSLKHSNVKIYLKFKYCMYLCNQRTKKV